MLSFLRQVPTRLPPDEAFDVLALLRHVATWDPRARDRRRTGGGFGVSFSGCTVPTAYAVTALARPSRIEWVGQTDLVRHTDEVRLVERGDGSTRVDYAASFEFGCATWLLDHVLEPTLRRVCDDAETGLGQRLSPSDPDDLPARGPTGGAPPTGHHRPDRSGDHRT